MQERVRVAIVGASGYTGAELLRLLPQHPHVEIAALTGDSQAGQPIGQVFPHLAQAGLPDLLSIAEVNFDTVDLVFCCLPHGTTQEIVASLPERLHIIDLSADFRLHSLEEYATWYGHEHRAPQLQKQAVYGLSEHARAEVSMARLVANPGCYPTCSLLPLLPLVREGLIATDNLIIDAKSGVSGAGRAPKRSLLFSEVSEGMTAYSVGGHRHTPEIEQALSGAAGAPVRVNFTPHLIPMRRGMVATIYATCTGGASVSAIHAALADAYANEPFVHVLRADETPSTHAVRGINECHIGVFKGRNEGDVILISAIDNLVKGASGQAVQNMNIMYGWEETTALRSVAMFP